MYNDLQEVYDMAVIGCILQGVQTSSQDSPPNFICLKNEDDKNGCRCAIGHARYTCNDSVASLTDDERSSIIIVHDHFPPSEWPKKFKQLAKIMKLDDSVVDFAVQTRKDYEKMGVV